MGKHSLAPWYFDAETGEILSAPSPHSNLSTLIGEVDGEGDGALIAAAPDLLAALEGLLAEYDSMNDILRSYGQGRPESDDGAHPDSAGQEARSAIAKARGE